MRRPGAIDRAERLARLGLAIQKDAVIPVLGLVFNERPSASQFARVTIEKCRLIELEVLRHLRDIVIGNPDVARWTRATVTTLRTGKPQSVGIPLLVG